MIHRPRKAGLASSSLFVDACPLALTSTTSFSQSSIHSLLGYPSVNHVRNTRRRSSHNSLVYQTASAAIGNHEVSPSKRNAWKSADPKKRQKSLPHDAELDRQLAVWDSMDSSLLTTLQEFEDNILWPVDSAGDIPRPSLNAVNTMRKVVRRLFFTEDGEERQDVSEDVIARTIVDDVLNAKNVFPGELHAALSQNKYNSTDSTKSKVDAALYPPEFVPEDGCPDWTHLRLFIEFKKGGVSNDPFDDESDNPESWARTRAEVRGQLIAYASTTFQYQHRTGLYSLLINGSQFRAMYWDRSGLIVSKATDYVEDPCSLLRFLWAFAKLSEERQGIDPTATLLSEESDDYKTMDLWAIANNALDMPYKEYDDITPFFDPKRTPSLGPAARTRQKARQPGAEPIFKYVRDGFRESLVPGWPRYQLLVGKSKRKFLVGKPIFVSSSMFGRGTRGYIALDVENQKLVFLKDSWRPFYEGVEPEGTYLETMASKPGVKLPGIPSVIEHGDVLEQTTFVAEYSNAQQSQPQNRRENENSSSTACSKKRAREDEEPTGSVDSEECRMFIHYRIAVNEVCLQMGEFRSGKQLVRMFLDCIRTHRDAYQNFDLLHRDISSGNLLILPSVHELADGRRLVGWHGFLTDWELAKYVPKDGSKQRARQPERTGTWQFMSVAYVRHPERPVAIADELESFLHVLIHHAVRYLRHSLHKIVTPFIISYFDTFQQVDEDETRCSFSKCYAVSHGHIRVDEKLLQFRLNNQHPDHPLNELLWQWLSYFVARYTLLNEADGESPLPESLTMQPANQPIEEDVDEIAGDFAFDPEEDGSAVASPIPPPMVFSKAEALDKAQGLDTHANTIGLLKRLLREPTHPWPADDVVGDQLDDNYNPKKQIIDMMANMKSALTSGRHSTSSKKARLNASGAAKSGTSTVATTRHNKFTKSKQYAQRPRDRGA